MAKARMGTSVKKGLKFFLYGLQGTWKSSFALNFLKMTNEEGKPLRVFYLDTESGSIDNYLEQLEDQGYDLANLLIVNTNLYSESEEWLDDVINNRDLMVEDPNSEMDEDGNYGTMVALDADGNPFRADVIVLDSITPIIDTVKYGMIKTSEKRARLKTKKKEGSTATEVFVAESTAGMEFKDYDKLQAKGKNLLRGLVTRTSKYVCVIAREKDKKESVKSGNSFNSVKVGVMPDAPKDAEYEFFTVVHMFEDEDTGEIKGQIDKKDRTLTFERGEIIEEISPELWQGVIDGNKGKKSAPTIDEKYDDTIDKEAEALYGNKKAPTSNTTQGSESDEVSIDETDPSAIVDEIKQIRSGLSPTKRQALGASFTKAKLPKIPKTTLEIDVLVKMLEVAKSM